MTKPRFKEVVPHAKHQPEPRYRPSADQHQEHARTSHRGRLRLGPADARGHVAELDDALADTAALAAQRHAAFGRA